ncbi:hypothetical protein BJF78_29400 [Pseudonocardia sp. CNS-139]|nr:hypothetical protein BJF78_29400 [Pseudonocardia sp. CNS-139]
MHEREVQVGMVRADVVHELVGPVAGHQHDVGHAVQAQAVQDAVDDGALADLQQRLVPVVRERPHPPAVAGGENDCLH